MNKRIDKQTDGQTDDGGSVHRLNFPSLASQKKEEKKTGNQISQAFILSSNTVFS